jgi:uncharacterized protein YebE (UPF0316 family)
MAMSDPFISSGIFEWIILPLLIFSARICDVTLGTIRVIFISKGIKYLAPIIGFFEVIIWLLAIGQVMNNVTNVASYIAYGAGFAFGTFAGMLIEEKLSIGLVSIRIVTKDDPGELIGYMRSKNYGVTSIDGEGATGPVKMIYSTIRREDLPLVIPVIEKYHPNAFYTIEEIKSVSEGIFPRHRERFPAVFFEGLQVFRKGK